MSEKDEASMSAMDIVREVYRIMETALTDDDELEASKLIDRWYEARVHEEALESERVAGTELRPESQEALQTEAEYCRCDTPIGRSDRPGCAHCGKSFPGDIRKPAPVQSAEPCGKCRFTGHPSKDCECCGPPAWEGYQEIATGQSAEELLSALLDNLYARSITSVVKLIEADRAAQRQAGRDEERAEWNPIVDHERAESQARLQDSRKEHSQLVLLEARYAAVVKAAEKAALDLECISASIETHCEKDIVGMIDKVTANIDKALSGLDEAKGGE